MSEKSILDQIITNHKAEEIANLNAYEIVTNLFNELNDRERDVLRRRFGLHEQEEKETLEKIGQTHSLTRERIRQIEISGVNKLKKLGTLEGCLAGLKNVVNHLLEEHGGLMEKEYLLNNLVYISLTSAGGQKEETGSHKNYFDFLILKLLNDEFEEVSNSANFKAFLRRRYQELKHLEEIAEELEKSVNEAKQVVTTIELINIAKELDSYKKHIDKLSAANNIDISGVLAGAIAKEDFDLVNANKTIYSILQAAKRIEQNKYGQWGLYQWREIIPKTINDKIYLVLKNQGEPMHFVKIAEKINKIGFDHKKSNPATVHNELILDNKYVLVGRGLYGLKEWGYKEGTVADVVAEIMTEADRPLTRDEIIEKTLAKRMVKQTTIILALMNRNRFERIDGDKYQLKNK